MNNLEVKEGRRLRGLALMNRGPSPLMQVQIPPSIFMAIYPSIGMNLILSILIPLILTSLWLYTAYLTRTSFPQLRNKRICLLIAHPDDEAMFFSPTLLALTDPDLGNHVKILCLSTGNNDGLGAVRQTELVASAGILGLRAPQKDVLVIDSPTFPDSMTAEWPAKAIAELLSSAFSPASKSHSESTSRGPSSGGRTSEGPPDVTIDVLVTFDRAGVSGHTNHISLYHGARAWLEGLMRGHEGWRCPVQLYTLTSTNIVRKYISVFDAPVTMIWGIVRDAFKKSRKVQSRSSEGREGASGAAPSKLLFVNDVMQYRTAQRAMTNGHKSQMIWFRWGWIGVGRFMIVNDLKHEVIK